MKRKYWMPLTAAGIIAAGLLLNWILGNQRQPMRRRPAATQQKPLTILPVKYEDITANVEVSGPLAAYDKVEIFAEVSGVLQSTPKRFRAGTRYRKGELLVQIDDRVFRNNVLSQKSGLLNQITLLLPDLAIDFPASAPTWEKYLKQFRLNLPLEPLPEPASDQERYYIASRNIYQQYYNIKSMEATLSKYGLRAPFDGIVSSSAINPGTLVRVGQKLGDFISSARFEMEAIVRLGHAKRLRIGQPVTLKSEDLAGSFEGKIARINNVLDQQTMSVYIYIELYDQRLQDGLYMTGTTRAEPLKSVFSLKKDLLVGRDQIYAVEDSILVLKRIEIVSEDGDIMHLRGPAEGTLILTEVWEEGREGMKLPASLYGPGMSAGEGSGKPAKK